MDIAEILKKYKNVAVVGLSKEPDTNSNKVALYLKSNGYKIVPVNPFVYEILDEKCYASLDEVPGEIEIVAIFGPAEETDSIVESAIKKKAKVVWMQLGIKNESAAEKARQAGLEVVMDKCIMIEHKRFQELTLLEKSRTVLVPILTEKENSPDFIERIKDCTKVIMLFVVDKNFLNHVPATFVSSRIQMVQETIDGIKKSLPQNISAKDFVEWGEWDEKIENLARLEGVDEIVMKKSSAADELSMKVSEKGLKVSIVQ
jgi:hypothetical protein